jgi:hypothetical protein
VHSRRLPSHLVEVVPASSLLDRQLGGARAVSLTSSGASTAVGPSALALSSTSTAVGPIHLSAASPVVVPSASAAPRRLSAPSA